MPCSPRVDKRSRSARKTLLRAIVAGIKKRLGGIPKLTIANVEYTPPELAQFFQDELETILAVEAAEAQRKAGRLREHVAVKAEAIAKAKATRDARHTMGKRQRKRVRG